MTTGYKIVRVTEEPRRYRWLTRLLGHRIREQIVFIPSYVRIDRHVGRPDRITVR